MKTWEITSENEKIGTLIWDFTPKYPEDNTQTLEIGQRVYILEKTTNWYRIVVLREKLSNSYVIPISYVKLLKSSPEPLGRLKYLRREPDIYSEKIYNALQSWILSIRNITRQFDLNKICILFQELIGIRKSIVESGSKFDPSYIVKLINEGNRCFGLEHIPFVNNSFMDISNSSLHEIFTTHNDILMENPDSFLGSTFGSMVDGGSLSNKPKYLHDEFFIHLKVDKIHSDLIDPSLWLLGIYDSTTDTYVTEKFCINFKDSLASLSSINSSHLALFELTKSNILHTLYLFIKVYRISSLTSEKKGESQGSYKRPYSYAFLPLTEILKDHPLIEHHDKLILQQCDESEFGNIEKQTPKENLGSGRNISTLGHTFDVSLKYYNSSLSSIKSNHPEIFHDDLYVIKLCGMPDTHHPDRFQNDFYLTIRGVFFDKFVLKGKPMNIETAISVWTSQGQLLSNCIRIGYGKDVFPQTEYKSAVIYHVNSPVWNETIGIIFPDNRMDNIRILITFSHISSSPGKSKIDKMSMLAFTVIKLETNFHTILGNIEGSYFLKKIETTGSSSKNSQVSLMDDVRKLSTYFKERYSTSENIADETNKFGQSDLLYIKTKLFSTIYTSVVNVHILKELESERDKADIKETFIRFPYVDTLEVAKFLKPLFTNIFQNIEPIDEAGDNLYYFQACAKVLSVVNEKRFSNYIPVLEKAIESTHMPNAWRLLIEYVEYSIKKVAERDQHIYYDVVKIFIDNLFYIFRVLVTSFKQSTERSPDHDEKMSPKLMHLFKNMFALLSLDMPHIYPLQIKILNNFIVVIEDTHNIFTIAELGELISCLIPSIPNISTISTSSGVKTNNSIIYKIKFLKKVVQTENFKEPNFRSILCPIIMKNLNTFIQGECHLDICTETADVLMTTLKYTKIEEQAEEIKHLTTDLVMIFFDANQDLGSKGKSRANINTLTVLLSLLSIMPEEMFKDYYISLEENMRTDYITKMFRVFCNIFTSKYFPRMHTTVWLAVCHELLKITQYVKSQLESKFGNLKTENDFNLIHAFFDFTLEFINAPCLQLENIISFNVRENLYEGVDMRIEVSEIMFDLWEEMEHDTIAHLYDYSQTLVTTSLLEVPELRSIMFHILYDFLIYDYKANKNMDSVTRNIISYIDSDTYNDNRYKAFSTDFKRIMERLWNMCPDQDIKTVGLLVSRQILDTIDTLAYFSLPEKFDNCLILHVHRSFNMIKFHSDISHEDMVHSNTLRLLSYNELLEAHTEAAICYYNISQNYDWNLEEELPAIDKYERSTPCARKEMFLLRAVELFEKGFNLEMAVKCCKLLIPLYETHQINFLKLSELHCKIAELIRRIYCGESSMDNYYRLTFIGLDFPESVRNKSFICHMGSCASLGSTMQFITRNFPNAIVPATSTFDPDLKEKNVQYVFAQAFKPIPSDDELYSKIYKSSEPISRFYANYNVRKFYGCSTIESKRDKSTNTPPTVTFVKTICHTEYPLPSINMLSPIIEETKIVLSDFEQTLENITEHTNELTDLCRNLSANPGLIKNIQMKASGNLNAFVNGGLSLVVPKFFTGTYFLEHSHELCKLDSLREILQRFMDINATALEILNEYLSDTMGGFVSNLVNSYQLARQDLQEKTGIQPQDLSYLQTIYAVGTNPAAPGGYNSIKANPIVNQSTLSDSQQQISSRRETISSVDAKQQNTYSTIKVSKTFVKIQKATNAAEEEIRSRTSSMRSTDKGSSINDVKDTTDNSGPIIAEKFKKRYGLFKKK